MNLAFVPFFLSLSFLLLIVSGARAQWIADGIPVGAAANIQDMPAIIPDGTGGAIIAWRDDRGGFFDIYAQRIDATGAALWVPDGVAICLATNTQTSPVIVSDGAGGAIIAWEDYRMSPPSDIFVQRVNASGVPQWTANGVPLCTAANSQLAPGIVADGVGGAIVTWYDYRSGPTSDIYVQRVSAAGAAAWTANGVALCTAVENQLSPVITSDGSGGAIVAWYDLRGAANYDIYVRAVNFLGTPVWTANGVALCTAAGGQTFPEIVSDDAGGAIVVWQDYRGGAAADIYARRVSAAGAAQWAADGVALCTAADEQVDPAIVSDGSLGAIVAWRDARSGNYDIYTRRVTAAGVPTWIGNGVALCTAPANQHYPSIVADGSGGAIVAWEDGRNGVDLNVFAGRVNASGVPQWTANGVAVCTAADHQDATAIVLDGLGGAIIAWEDSRNNAVSVDVYAQRIEGRYGYWGNPEPFITSVADIPGDQGGKVKVDWTASGWDVLNFGTITHYSIWRATDAALLAGAVGNVIDDPSRVRPDFTGPAYWMQPNEDFYFEWVGNQNAMYLPAYTFSASTRADSTSEGAAPHYFLVFSHTADPFTFWPSNVDSGYSVDNLAPAAPLNLAAQGANSDVLLTWELVDDTDFAHYTVYRGVSPSVQPLPGNFVATTTDPNFTDVGAVAGGFFYIVTASDVNGNESGPSNVASLSSTTGVDGPPPVPALTVRNHPNPFAGGTVLEIGLPAESDVSIEVFSVTGERVRNTGLARRASGWQRVTFDGRDDAGRQLPSGVYFCRVTAAGSTVTRKVVIAR